MMLKVVDSVITFFSLLSIARSKDSFLQIFYKKMPPFTGASKPFRLDERFRKE